MKILSKKMIGKRHVYDLGVDRTQNFVANNVVVHNCTQRGAQKFFERAKPNSITDIAALTSIYRPGPLAAKVDDIYVEAKADPDSVVYEHPLVKKVLEPTYNCIIFQEQLMGLGHVVGGLSLEECDKLRKVITKRSSSGASKAKEEALKLEKKFIDGAVKNGLKEKVAKDLFEKIAYFSGYGFNSAHAVSYAIDSYMCAWLCTYYEPEWLCAYMETQDGQPEKRAKAISELRSFGYEIVKVDINYASEEWTIMPDKKFMPALSTVKGLGDAAIEEIKLNRPYRTVEDLLYNSDGSWKHSKFNKRAFENLIKICAFDSMDIVGETKYFRSYYHMWRCLIDDNAKIKHVKKGKQELERRVKELRDDSPEWDKSTLISQSKEIVGSGDMNLMIPSRLRDKLEELNVRSIDDFEGNGLYWFIIDELLIKKSKNNKTYAQIAAIGLAGKRQRIYCWGFSPEKHSLSVNGTFVAELEQSQYGFSTQIWKVKAVGEKKQK